MKFTPAIILFACLLLFTLGNACKKKKDPEPVNPPPATITYDFTWSAPIAGHPVTFTSNAPAGTKLLWEFEGVSNTVAQPEHTFKEAGSYEVSLTVNGDANTSVIKKIDIAWGVSFNYSGARVAGDTIRFTTSGAAAGTVYAWDFGDGGKSDEAAPYHIYQQPGKYNVKLNINNQYNALGPGVITVVNDPLYTNKIAGNRAWQFNSHRDYYSGTDTSYATNENFSVQVIDKITIGVPTNATLPSYMMLYYDPSLSKGNVLAYTSTGNTIYFDHAMDTTYLTYFNEYGKYNPHGNITPYKLYITGSSK